LEEIRMWRQEAMADSRIALPDVSGCEKWFPEMQGAQGSQWSQQQPLLSPLLQLLRSACMPITGSASVGRGATHPAWKARQQHLRSASESAQADALGNVVGFRHASFFGRQCDFAAFAGLPREVPGANSCKTAAAFIYVKMRP